MLPALRKRKRTSEEFSARQVVVTACVAARASEKSQSQVPVKDPGAEHRCYGIFLTHFAIRLA